MSRLTDTEIRTVYAIAARCLDYPTEELFADLSPLRTAVTGLPATHRPRLAALLDHLAATGHAVAAADYVAGFDLRRRCCLYLTYYSYGDTRKRGIGLLAFQNAYTRAGMTLRPDELPDHLCVVLEFAATVDLAAGRKLLESHRAGLELLRLALADTRSPYASLLDAVSATLAPLRGDQRTAVARLAAEGPPDEEVGLDSYPALDLTGARR